MSIKFRICNLIYRDYLRNYIVVDRLVIKDVVRMLEDGHYSESKMKMCAKKLRRVSDDMLWIMTGKE